MWFDDSLRFQMCEAGIDGFRPAAMRLCVTGIDGFMEQK